MNTIASPSEDFSAFWQRLRQDIKPGEVIRNWTARNGFLGDTFDVVKCEPGYLEVESAGAQNIQHVTRAEFEKVFQIWEDYVAGTMPRHHLRDLTRFSKYVISVIQHLGPR